MKKLIVASSIILLLNVACNKSRLGDADASRKPIVTVLENTLYVADLEGIIHYGMSVEDSTAATQAYIRMWINERLVFDKAKKNTIRKREIEELVDEYRNSLIINDYQTRLLRERLSKKISDGELLAFYNKNKERFALKENIIKGLYLKIPKESSQIDNFLKWYTQDNETAISNIENNMLQNAIGYENFYDYWVSFDEVLDNIPEYLRDSEDFLQRNKNLEKRDSSFIYLLNIKEYKTIGSEAPFEYIKDILLDAYMEEQRDLYIKELQTDLYNKALSNGDIKYYVE